MILTKLKEKSLITTEDVHFNYRLGIPIEVYCPKQAETIAFGQIQSYSEQCIYIRNESFCRNTYLFFGQPSLTKSS